MSSKRMPKTKPVKEDDLEKTDDIDNVSSDIEESDAIDDEDVEETTSSDENDEVYVESESEQEKDLKDEGVKEEEECDYEIESEVSPILHKRVERTKRSTRPILTHYERVKVLSVRATQISLGAKVFVRGVENRSPLEIATLELEQGLIPFIIIRPFPDNSFERWKLSELIHHE